MRNAPSLWSAHHANSYLQDHYSRELASYWSNPERLSAFAASEYAAVGGYARQWTTCSRWMSAFQTVIEHCDSHEPPINPQHFVRVQIRRLGAHYVKIGRRLMPGMLHSERAQERYRDACGIYSDDDFLALRIGEEDFAKRFLLLPNATPRRIETLVRRAHSRWSLARTRDRPDIRINALVTALDHIHPNLRYKHPAPHVIFRWLPERRRLHASLIRLREELRGYPSGPPSHVVDTIRWLGQILGEKPYTKLDRHRILYYL